MKTNDKTIKGATKKNNNSCNNDSEGATRCGASARVQKMLASLAPSEIVAINADAPEVVATAFSVVPVLRALRERVTELLPGTNMERYDAFEEIVQALASAHADYMVLSSESDGLGAKLSEAIELRSLLNSETVPMVKRGQLSDEQARACMQGQGFVGVGFDLQAQQRMFRAIWPSIKDRSGVTIEQLDHAEELGQALVQGRASRERRAELLTEKSTERQRCFSLLVREYREAQRVVTYLRWSEGDAEELAPSLWAKSGATRYKKEERAKEPTEKGDGGVKEGGGSVKG